MQSGAALTKTWTSPAERVQQYFLGGQTQVQACFALTSSDSNILQDGECYLIAKEKQLRELYMHCLGVMFQMYFFYYENLCYKETNDLF
jgi:hypothetical protein